MFRAPESFRPTAIAADAHVYFNGINFNDQSHVNMWNVNMVIARICVHLGTPRLQKQSFTIIFHSANYFGVFKVHTMVVFECMLGYFRIPIAMYDSSLVFFYSGF